MEKFRCLVNSTVIFVFLLSFYHTQAQGDTIFYGGNIYARVADAVTTDPAVKTDPLVKPDIASKFVLKENQVNIRAVRDFRKRYAHIAESTWTGFEEGFNVRFTENEVLTTVSYSPAGRWMHSMKRYREPQLPKAIRARVKSVYYDFAIVLVYEIQWDLTREPIHYVHLRWGQEYKVISVGADMVEVQHFQLQKK